MALNTKNTKHDMASIISIDELQVGDLIRNVLSMETYVVTAVQDDRATAVRSTDVTNPSEWKVFRPVVHVSENSG